MITSLNPATDEALAQFEPHAGDAIEQRLQRAADAGLMISVTADRVVRLLPALVIGADEVRGIASILVPLVRDFLAEAPAS